MGCEELIQKMVRDGSEIVTAQITLPQKGDNELVLPAKLLQLLSLLGRSGVVLDEAGMPRPVKRSEPLNIAASLTDAAGVPAVTGKILRVVGLYALAGGTATNLTVNSKPAGDGAAISALLANGVNGGEVLPMNPHGWFQSNVGEGLSLTTGAGATTGLQLYYIEVPNYLTGDDGLVLYADGAPQIA